MTRSALLAVLLLALGLSSTAAQTDGATGSAWPRLRSAATVSADIVLIGDLVENAGAAANTPIFRSPDLGQTGAVPVQAVLDAVRRYGLIAIDTRGVAEIAVTRISHAIGTEEIEARIAQLLTQRYSVGRAENLKLVMDRELRVIQLETNAAAELSLVRLAYDVSSRRFDATFELAGGSRKQWRYTGAAFETIEVAVPNRALTKGELIRASDIVVERRAKTEFSNEPPVPVSEIVGRAARRAVRSGQALRLADVMKPELVQRGDMVTLHYEVPGVAISMRGKALDAGAEGDSVNVLNELSKRTIQGVVTAAGHVTMPSRTPPSVVARAPVGQGESATNP